jgi:hypothetical protein
MRRQADTPPLAAAAAITGISSLADTPAAILFAITLAADYAFDIHTPSHAADARWLLLIRFRRHY